MLAAITTAALVFTATNIDDLVVLTLLFAASSAAGTRARPKIIAGQIVGIAALVAASLVAALGLRVIPAHWVGLFGVVPLVLGIWQLLRALTKNSGDSLPPTVGVGSVALIAIVNGADNLSIYTPLFRTLPAGEVTITLIVFVIMIGFWCVLAAWLGQHLGAIAVIRRFSHLLVPLVFIALGAVILTRWAVAA